MARTKKEPNRVDEILDELLEDCHSPEDILGESGLMHIHPTSGSYAL
jgi:putative transposase